MNYFEAVQEGRKRVNDAIAVLQPVAGPCYPMLFLKMGTNQWTPVGTENLWASVPGKEGTEALVICDADGNAKTMSTFVPHTTATKVSKALEEIRILHFDGEVKLPI